MQKLIILLLILLVSALMLFWLTFKENAVFPLATPDTQLASIFIDSTFVMVEVANTPEKKRKGLSGRNALPANQGMLFVLNSSDFHGIWMKDMKFPIDIIWINERLGIVDIKKDAQPDSYPAVFRPKQKSKYILEMNAGFTEIYNINVGDEIHL